MGFEVGRRVKCVKRDGWRAQAGNLADGPAFGSELIVTAVDWVEGFPGLPRAQFVGVDGAGATWRPWIRFHAAHFRPIEEGRSSACARFAPIRMASVLSKKRWSSGVGAWRRSGRREERRMDVEVGQRVRCINANGWVSVDGRVVESGPNPKGRYTVSAVAIGILDGAPCFALGIAEHPEFRGEPCFFTAEHFRPEGEGELQIMRERAASLPTKACEVAGLLP